MKTKNIKVDKELKHLIWVVLSLSFFLLMNTHLLGDGISLSIDFKSGGYQVKFSKQKAIIPRDANNIFGYVDGQGKESVLVLSRDGKIVAFDGGSLEKKWDISIDGIEWNAVVLIKTQPRQFLVVGSQGKVALVDDTGKYKFLKFYQDYQEVNFNAVYHDKNIDGNDNVVLGDLDGVLYICNLLGELIDCKTIKAHEWPIKKVAVYNEGNLVFTSAADSIKVWDGMTGKMLRELFDGQLGVSGFWFSDYKFYPDENLILATSSNELIAFNLASGELIGRLTGLDRDAELYRIELIPQTRKVLATTRDGKVVLWNLDLPVGEKNAVKVAQGNLPFFGFMGFFGDFSYMVTEKKVAMITWEIHLLGKKIVPILHVIDLAATFKGDF